jgi:arylformamidase
MKHNQLIIDISPTISEHMAVWPGDTPFSRQKICELKQGHTVELTSFSSTAHIGAHADSWAHYVPNTATIDEMPLEAYIGPCYVATVPIPKNIPENFVIKADLLLDALKLNPERLLLRTLTCPDSRTFTTNFPAICPDLITTLGQSGCRLIGIDTPSVDPFSSKTLDAHKALYRHRMVNLEGLDLSHVKDGFYELIAAPLKLGQCDASPVRALLRSLNPSF